MASTGLEAAGEVSLELESKPVATAEADADTNGRALPFSFAVRPNSVMVRIATLSMRLPRSV